MKLRPKGVVSRIPADWFVDQLYAVDIIGASVAGPTSYLGVYNATVGVPVNLVVVGFTIGSASSQFGVFEWYQGDGSGYAGTANFSTVAAFPVNAKSPAGVGKGTTFTSAVCIGNHIGVMGASGANFFWPYSFPLAVVPPGYSVAWQSQLANSSPRAGFWWYEVPA